MNPQILPPTVRTKQEHNHHIRTGLFAAGAAIGLGICFWYIASQVVNQPSSTPTDARARERAEVAALLTSAAVPADPAEVERIAEALSRLSSPPPEDLAADRQRVAAELSNSR